jgi:hypothetical protein
LSGERPRVIERYAVTHDLAASLASDEEPVVG